jgi:hypothetical protein
MTKYERNKARAEGKIIIRAQHTRKGWRIVRFTHSGGWVIIYEKVYDNREIALDACREIVGLNPDKYCDDNY